MEREREEENWIKLVDSTFLMNINPKRSGKEMYKRCIFLNAKAKMSGLRPLTHLE